MFDKLTPKQLAAGCKYFNGLANTTCAAGVNYADVTDDSTGQRRWPCSDFSERGYAHTCVKRAFATEAELEAEEAEIAAFIEQMVKRLNTFATGESHNCPHCGQPVESARLYGKFQPGMYSLYVDPCGCRLGLWRKAPDWIENVTVIPSVLTCVEPDDIA